jgi:hypothetical protein
VAEQNGTFQYKPGALSYSSTDESKSGTTTTIGLEKEDKLNYINHSSSVQKSVSSSLPPPLVPSSASPSNIPKSSIGVPPPSLTQHPPLPPSSVSNHNNHNNDDANDEFLDPELDLELDGMNLDADTGVRINII